MKKPLSKDYVRDNIVMFNVGLLWICIDIVDDKWHFTIAKLHTHATYLEIESIRNTYIPEDVNIVMPIPQALNKPEKSIYVLSFWEQKK